jgi:hypothetical protein
VVETSLTQDTVPQPPAIQGIGETVHLEAEPGCVPNEVLPFQPILVSEEELVHLPEFSLLMGRQDSLVGQRRITVIPQRKMFEDPADLSGIDFKKSLERP